MSDKIDRRTMLTLDVEPMLGSSILESVIHMVRISNLLQCITKTNFNGVTALVFPGDNPDHLARAYSFALSSGRTIITSNSPT